MAPLDLTWLSDNRRGLRRLVTWIAAGIPLFVALTVPIGWFMAGYAYEMSRIATSTDLVADTVSKYIYFNPELWRYDEQHISQVISEFAFTNAETRLRVLDFNDDLVAQIGPLPDWPVMNHYAELTNGAGVVGVIETQHSLRGLLNDSMGAAVVGAVLAGLMFAALRLVPLRALDRAMYELEESQKALKGRVTESETTLQIRVDELQEATVRLRKQRHELKLYAQQAAESRDAAQAANRSKSEFLANMSHELRTPLNAVIGFSDMMRNELLGPVGNPQYLSYARDIHGSGEHLLGLINDILDISKIESGEMELYEEPIDLNQLVRSSITLVKTRARDGGVTLDNRTADHLPALNGDARKIKQIIINLLSNAVKFTPNGGSVSIITAHNEENRLTIQITDTGIGIAAGDIEKVMKPFVQADSTLARLYEGTGLGLPLAKALIELHGGSINLVSSLNEGTTATVVFPARRTIMEQAMSEEFYGVAELHAAQT